jgi:uncharacterized protein involved in exopolysaccharide biosynthesis
MARDTKVREPAEFADLDAEREVDLRRYWNALVARWWLPLAGLVVGLIIGYLLSLGGNQVYKATALLYLGQPLAGNTTIQSLATNPATVNEIIHSEATARMAAARAGLRPGQVRNNISSRAISGAKGAIKSGQTPLIEISLTGKAPRKTAIAAAAVADDVVNKLSVYVNTKIAGYKTLLASLDSQLASNKKRIDDLNAAISGAQGLSEIDKLLLVTQADGAEQLRGQLVQNQTLTQQQLSLAENVEKPQVVQRPVPVKTTARSTRNSMLVGGVIGLLIGLFAALLWDPVARRFGRRTS